MATFSVYVSFAVSECAILYCILLLLPQGANGEVSNEGGGDGEELEDVMEFWILGACGLGSVITVRFSRKVTLYCQISFIYTPTLAHLLGFVKVYSVKIYLYL